MKDQILHPQIENRLWLLLSDINLMLSVRQDDGEVEVLEHDKQLIVNLVKGKRKKP